MLVNERTAVCTNKIMLVPYCRRHVTTYHDWMKDPDIQAATASEPLTVDQEYAMQQSWRTDCDKLTFILCVAPSDAAHIPQSQAEIASMIGDVNMFVSVQESEDGQLSLVGELELMVAIKDFQRRGYGRSAVLAFLYYVLQHEKKIVQQYYDQFASPLHHKAFDYFAVKINEENERSLMLFQKLGFEKTTTAPSYFGEFELRRYGLSCEAVHSMFSDYGIEHYREIDYTSDDADGKQE